MNPTMERGTLWLNKDFTEMAVAIQKTGVPEALQMGSLTGLYSCEFILDISRLCFHCRVLWPCSIQSRRDRWCEAPEM